MSGIDEGRQNKLAKPASNSNLTHSRWRLPKETGEPHRKAGHETQGASCLQSQNGTGISA